MPLRSNGRCRGPAGRRSAGRRPARRAPPGGPGPAAAAAPASACGPDSSRDSVLTEMPVAAASSARRELALAAQRPQPRADRRRARRRSARRRLCHTGNGTCRSRLTVRADSGRHDDETIRRGGDRWRRRRAERGLALARSRRGAGGRRGRAAQRPGRAVHNYLGREGTPPAELLADRPRRGGRATAATVVDGRVDRGRAGGRRPSASTLDGRPSVRARRLLVTTGLSTSCPTCPGWPSGGAATCCTARTATAGRCATRRSASSRPARWPCTRRCCSGSGARDVVLFRHTGPALAPEEAEQLAARGVRGRRRRGGRAGGGRRPAHRGPAGRRRGRAAVGARRGAAVHRPRRRAGVARARAGRPGDGGARRRQRTCRPTRPGPPPCPACGWRATSPTCARRWSSPPPRAAGRRHDQRRPGRRGHPRWPSTAHRSRGSMSAYDEESYEELYRSTPALWSGRPNRQLVVEATDLPPGTGTGRRLRRGRRRPVARRARLAGHRGRLLDRRAGAGRRAGRRGRGSPTGSSGCTPTCAVDAAGGPLRPGDGALHARGLGRPRGAVPPARRRGRARRHPARRRPPARRGRGATATSTARARGAAPARPRGVLHRRGRRGGARPRGVARRRHRDPGPRPGGRRADGQPGAGHRARRAAAGQERGRPRSASAAR